MNFMAKYRASNGRIETITISAKDRAAASATLKARGIAAVNLRELGSREFSAHSGGTTGGASWFGILKTAAVAATAAIALGGGVWLWMSRGREDVSVRRPVKTPPKKIEKPKSSHPKRMTVKNHPVKVERKLSPREKREKRREEILANLKPPVRKDVEERPDGSFLYTDSKGRRICCLQKHEVVDEQNKFRSPFKHKVEAYLSNFAIPGQRIPPMPPMKFSLEELQASLDETIVVDMDNDDEDIIAKKQNVQQIKEFLKEAIAQGMSFEEFVQRLEERQRKEATLVQESRRLILQTLAEGKAGEAKELLDALNKNLNKDGIPDLRLPAKYRRMMEVQQ